MLSESIVVEYLVKKMVSNIHTIAEMFFWILIAFLFSLPILNDFFWYGSIQSETIYGNSSQLVYSFILIVGPVVFGFVYGDLPLNFLKNKRSRAEIINLQRQVGEPNAETKREFDNSVESSELNDLYVEPRTVSKSLDASSETVVEYIRYMMLTSTQLANRMLRNASLYLFSGVLIAIVGLGFFYTQTLNSVSSSGLLNTISFSSTMIALIPKFGILFFIEFIAFFFLKQYRTSMDEFRYYESLKRSREETYAIVRLMMLDGGKINVLNLIEKYGFRTKLDKLEAGQSLDHLEARKLDKSELEILAKIVEVFGKK